MSGFFVPACEAESEFVEKRSRFLGHLWPVESEEEARRHIEAVKKLHRDARHNCWCYRLQSGVERYSDDSEPQGTAGVPMLAVFQKANVTGVCCVVTRYFGGVLLGAGGLVRAYTQATKDALSAAGIGQVRPFAQLTLPCPYPLFEQMKLLVAQHSGLVEALDYTETITMTLLFPTENVEAFSASVTELTSGGLAPVFQGEILRAVAQER